MREKAGAEVGVRQGRDLVPQGLILDLREDRVLAERIERQLQPEQYAHRPAADLGLHRQAGVDGGRQSGQHRLPAARRLGTLHQGERQRPAGALDDAADHGQLGRAVREEVRDQLQHALAGGGQAQGDARQLVLAGGQGRVGWPSLVRWLRVREVEKPRAPASTACRAMSAMAAMSAGVAGSRLAPRSPIT
jgi:hypothetical protein